MKNKIISILLTVCLLAGLLPAVTVTAHAAGDLPNAHGETGSNDRPYIINEASDFSWITSNKKFSGYFLQTADIDLTSFTWIPIGDNVSQFCGQYNGNGYTIRNMSLNDGSLSYIGMFGYTSNATIENVTLDNVSFTGGQTVNQAVVGSIAGMAGSGTVVQRCRVTGSITGATNDTIGGIVGSNGATVKFCSSAATITAGAFDSGSAPNTGGIVGSNWGGTIQNCSNTGSVSSGAGTSVGGIVGFCYSSGNTVSNCFSTGTVTGPADSSGAIIGKVDGGTAFTASSANYYLTGSAASGGTGTASASGLTASAETADSLKLQSTYSGWDFSTNAWLIQSGRNNGYPFLKGVATVAPTGAAASISATGATLSGNVTAAGDGTVTERGIRYLKISGGTSTKAAASSAGLGTFSVSLTGLEPVTQYCAMAYAVNEVGTAYGEPIYFSTTPKLSMTVSPGSVVGATKAVISDTVANHFMVNVTDTATGYVDAGNAAPTTGANLISPYVSGNDITTGVAVGKYLQVYNVDSNGKIVNMNEIQLNTGHIKSADLTLPYTQSFENGGNLPADWNTQDVENTSGYSMWSCTTATGDGSGSTVTPVTGSYMAQAEFWDFSSGQTSRLSLAREIALPANGTYNLSFYMYHSQVDNSSPNDAIQPQVSTDGGITWSDLGPQLLRTSGSGWVQHTISLNDYAGNSVRIGFLGISDYGYNVFLDELNVVSLGPVISVTDTGTTGSTYGSTNSRSFSIADSNFTTVPTAYTAEWCNADGTTTNAPSAGTLSVGTVTGGDATLTLTPSATADAGTYSFKVSSGDTSTVTAFTIAKADAATAMKTVAATVSSLGKTGAAATLPALPAGAGYGAPTYAGAVVCSNASVSGTTLTFNAAASTAGQTGTITIPVSGAANYKNYDLVITVVNCKCKLNTNIIKKHYQ